MANWQSELELAWQAQLTDLVTAIACAPNGSSWAASSAAGEVVWNPGLLDLVSLQVAGNRSIDCLAFSADSRWLAAGGQTGELLIWDCADCHSPPRLVQQIQIGKWIEQLAWHPVAAQLAIGVGATVQIWDVPTGTEIHTTKFTKSAIFDLAWHPAGSELAMAGYQGVQLWSELGHTAPAAEIETATASIQLAWARDGRYLAAGNLDRTLTIVDWHNPTQRWLLAGCPGKIRHIVWIAGDTTPCLAVASGLAIVLWQLNSAATAWEGQLLEGHQEPVVSLAAHPSLPLFASASSDRHLCLWSAQGEIHQIITDGVSQFTVMAWQSQSQYLLAGSQSGSISLWLMPA